MSIDLYYFVSYAHKDKAQAQQLLELLAPRLAINRGFDCSHWIDDAIGYGRASSSTGYPNRVGYLGRASKLPDPGRVAGSLSKVPDDRSSTCGRGRRLGVVEAQAPDEWAMEVSIGFKGETQPIPVVVAGSAAGSVKVTAKWKRKD